MPEDSTLAALYQQEKIVILKIAVLGYNYVISNNFFFS